MCEVNRLVERERDPLNCDRLAPKLCNITGLKNCALHVSMLWTLTQSLQMQPNSLSQPANRVSAFTSIAVWSERGDIRLGTVIPRYGYTSLYLSLPVSASGSPIHWQLWIHLGYNRTWNGFSGLQMTSDGAAVQSPCRKQSNKALQQGFICTATQSQRLRRSRAHSFNRHSHSQTCFD